MAKPTSVRDATTWRYCISREREYLDGSDYFAIREVYEDADGQLSWTEDAIKPEGATWQDIANTLALIGKAVNGGVLDLTLDPPQLVHPREVRQRKDGAADDVSR